MDRFSCVRSAQIPKPFAARKLLPVLLIALAFLLLQPLAARAGTVSPGATLKRWETSELVLVASNAYTNAYTDVEVTAQFSGPAGAAFTVHGFWDGGNTFKVRFTPTVEGNWTYTVSSSPVDSGLTAAGSFTVVAADAANSGFLRRDPANPSSFVFDDGRRHFMWGQTYYEIIKNAMAGNKWQTSIVNSKARGMNKVRMLIYPWPTARSDNRYPDTEPFLAGDHNQLNLPHWQKLDEVVRYLDSQGMIADLIIFTDADRTYGSQLQDERYLRYVIARYAAYHNVIWCLTNEWDYTGQVEAYWDNIGAIVRAEDPWMTQGTFLRPLSIHQKTGSAFHYFSSGWPVHAIVQFGVRNATYAYGDAWGNYSIVNNLGRGLPVVNDEYGYIGETSPINLTQTQHRNAIWGIAVAGGYGAAGDTRNASGSIAYLSAGWKDASEYTDIKRMVGFWTTRGIEYWKMTSQNSMVLAGTRVYALANPGSEYVIYAAKGGSFKINLPQGNVTYKVLRFNPRDGTQAFLPNIAGGGTPTLQMPDTNDWIVWIYNSTLPRS